MFEKVCFIVLFTVCGCYGIVYNLNDTEYEQLPPLFELDDYDACLLNSDIYCMATFELHGGPGNKLYNLIQDHSKHTVKHYNHKIIERGVCVQRACANYIKNKELNNTSDLELILEGCLNDTMGQKYDLGTRMHTITCTTQNDEKDPLKNTDYIVAAVVVILIILVIIGSYYDRIRKKNNTENLGTGPQSLLCFSIFCNMEKLTYVNKDSEHSDLKGISAIRTITEALIVYGHVIYLFGSFTTNTHAFEKTYDSPFQRVIYSSTSVVQLFFFISGFLFTYSLHITETKQSTSWRNIPRYIFSRWWRLTPPLAMVLAIMATWFRFLGSGPLWKRHVIEGVTPECSSYYWTHIFYFNNYMRDEYMCSPESWHIAADTQLFILGLIVHFLIRKKSWRFKLGTLTALLVIGIASPIAYVILWDMDGFLALSPEFYRTLRDMAFRTYHILGHNNITCYIMGVANGYIYHYLRQKKVEFPNFKFGRILTWFTIPFIVYVFYVASTYLEDGDRPSITSRALYAGMHRVVIGLIASFYNMATVMKFNGFATHVFDRDVWQVPARLSYCVFLVHDNVLQYMMATRTHLVTYTFSNLLVQYVGVLALSQVLALILHLLVEAPAIQLFKVIMSDERNKKKVA